MLEHNRNLSSIVGAIQDDGPPASAPKGPATLVRDVKDAAGSAEAETLSPVRAGRQRATRRAFIFLLFATLVVAAGFIFISENKEGYLADFTYGAGQYITGLFTQAENAASNPGGSTNPAGAGEPVVPAVVAERDDNAGNHEIHERQALIMKRLEELTAAMADIKAGNEQYRLSSQDELKGMQEDFQNKIDSIAAAVAGLQASPASREGSSQQPPKGSRDASVAPSGSGTVPASGGWVVNVANSAHLETIEKLKKKLHKHGIRSESQAVTIDGKARYRLRIPGFSSSDEARDYAHNLDGDLGLKGPWISKR